jgi:DNA mismatch repair protein MutS2
MFDEQGLKPLFSINYGVPGSSFGLSIAESLGMPTSLIRRAQGHVDEKEAAFIESIRILQDEKKRVQGLREALEDLEKRRTDAVARFRSDRALFMEKARERVLDRIRRLEKEFSEASLSIKAMDSTNVREAGRLKALARESGEAVLKGLGKARKTHEPRVNDHVVISGSAGTVTKVDIEGKKAEVIVKGLKVWVSWDKIEGIGKTKAKAFKGAEISADMEVSSTINIIGMRSEEALAEITRFIDNAHASGLDSINVVHGVGTGALKKTVEDYLRSNARIVKGFRQAGQGQGGAGVTIVELR